MKIRYIKGDATCPVGDGRKYIIHCCNDLGLWGSGFVIALSNRWPEPEGEYRRWFKKGGFLTTETAVVPGIGNTQFVEVTSDIVVCNMIGQHGIRRARGKPPIRYVAIETCLSQVRKRMQEEFKIYDDAPSVHCPRFGSDRAGGKWEHIESLIAEQLLEHNVSVTVYNL